MDDGGRAQYREERRWARDSELHVCGSFGKSGGILHAVIDEVTGLLVEPDKESIAAAIIRLLSDENLRRRLGAQARHRVVEEMDVHVTVKRTEEILRSCCCAL